MGLDTVHHVDQVAPILWVGVQRLTLDEKDVSPKTLLRRCCQAERALLYIDVEDAVTTERLLGILLPLAGRAELRMLATGWKNEPDFAKGAPALPRELEIGVLQQSPRDRASTYASRLFQEGSSCPAFAAAGQAIASVPPAEKLSRLGHLCAAALEQCGCSKLDVQAVDALFGAMADNWDSCNGWVALHLAASSQRAEVVQVDGNALASAVVKVAGERDRAGNTAPVHFQFQK